MKHLDLKPVADSCKKMLYKGCLFVGAVAACGLAACSDDYEGTVSMNFPQMQTIVCNADETKDFSFDASAEWSLSSSEIWCKLVQDGQESFVISGTGGTQHITIHVTDENSTAEEASTAKLELTMGNRTVAIAEVIRSAKGSELKIYDMDGNELEYLTVGYSDYEPFKVKANYHFAVTGTPDWVDVEGGSLVGTSNQEVEGALQIVQDGTVEKYPVTVEDGAKIVFSAEDGRAYAEFPLVYAGMDPMDIEVTTPSTNKYNWVVSLDGKTIMQEGSQSSALSYVNKVPFTVKALNDDYEFVFLESGFMEGSLFLMLPESAWMRCEGDKGDISLYVDPYEPEQGFPETRTGYVLAFSREEYNLIKDDLENTLIVDGDVAYEYQQRNLLMQFTQKSIESSEGITGEFFGAVTSGYVGGTPLESALLNSGDRLNAYQSAYGVSSVLDVTIPTGTLSVYVMLTFTPGEVQLVNSEGESMSGILAEIGMNGGMGDDEGSYYIGISGLGSLSEDALAIISESTGDRKVMVVVHPASQSGEEIDRLVVTDMSTTPLTCSVYSGGDAADLKATYGCEEIWQIDNPASDMCVSLASGTDIDTNGIKMYQYVWGETEFTEIPNSNGEWMYDNWNGLMIWSGTGSWGTSNLYQKDVLIVIPDVNGKKYGLMYIYYGDL